jgi:hypothetical protein
MIDAAKEAYTWLVAQGKRLVISHVASTRYSSTHANTRRNSWLVGYAEGIEAQVCAILDSRQTADAGSPDGRMACLVKTNETLAKEYIQDTFGKTGKKRLNNTYGDRRSHGAGYQIGSKQPLSNVGVLA